jgi:hypothetical protein
MANRLVETLAFDIVGSLLNAQIPKYLRATIAHWEGFVNGSWTQVAYARHHPRFSSQAVLTLEKSSINFLTYPTHLGHSSWVKGSSMIIFPDHITGPNKNYRSDRVVVSSSTGNNAAQTLSKAIVLSPATAYTATVCLRLADGRFGAGDYLEIGGSVVGGTQRVYLANTYNDQIGNYIPLYIPFTTGGTAADYASQVLQTVNLNLFVNQTVSLDWAYGQIEPGAVPTSYIDQNANVQTRDRDFIQYPFSPIEKLSSWVFYENLRSWREDGALIDVGNFKVEIFQGKVRVTCGTTVCTAPALLTTSAKIAVRVSQGLGKVRLYIDGVMVAQENLPTGYVAATSTVTLAGVGVRSLSCLYFFNQDLSDNVLNVGDAIGGDLYKLHQNDSLITELTEGYGMTVLSPITVPAGKTTEVRFQPVQNARQTITSIASSGGKTAQVDRVTVQTIVNPAATQTDWVQIADTRYTVTSDATPTKPEVAALLAAAVNALPKKQPVTAAYVSGDSFTIAADTQGDYFELTTGDNLSRVTTAPNQVDTHTFTVPNAVDYTPGVAVIFRDYAFIAELRILSVNTGTNQLTVQFTPNSQVNLVKLGDALIQPRWQLEIGRNSYFCHHLEDFPDIKVTSKALTNFRYRNTGTVDRTITPYVKIAL